MLTLFIRAIILYVILMLSMRAMGKRQLGQFQPYEFVIVMWIANLVATPMGDVSTPLLSGLLPVAALFSAHCLITALCMRSDRMRAFLCGKPSLIISKGVIQERELEKLNLTLADLLEGLRSCGLQNPAEVCTAVMESNGTISAFPFSSARAPMTKEMGVDPGYEGYPLVLVMDGRIQDHNLAAGQLDVSWLRRKLSDRGLAPEGVFLCSLDTQGRMMVQEKGGGVSHFDAMPAQEVKW